MQRVYYTILATILAPVAAILAATGRVPAAAAPSPAQIQYPSMPCVTEMKEDPVTARREASRIVAIGPISTILTGMSAEDSAPCPSTHDLSTDGEVTATGESYFFSDPSDLVFATEEAQAKLAAKLGRVSGVVCDICEDSGLQCSRTLDYGDGTPSSSPVFIPGETEQESGWCVTAGWSGEYTVRCEVCPEVRPS